jgi:hypothetical protein
MNRKEMIDELKICSRYIASRKEAESTESIITFGELDNTIEYIVYDFCPEVISISVLINKSDYLFEDINWDEITDEQLQKYIELIHS